MPETKAFMKAQFLSTREPPGRACVQIQRQLLERFGVTADYGVSQLNAIGSSSRNPDQEVLSKMQHFSMAMQTATREATFSDAERESFYADIPPFMHHVPYMWVINKQQQMMSEMQSQQAMMSDQLERLMRDPESVRKLQDFALQVRAIQERKIKELEGWSAAQREEFFADFQSDPVLRDIVNSGATLHARLAKFTQMPDELTERMVAMATVLNDDVRAKGRIVQAMMGKGGVVQSVMQSWGALVRAGMKSLSESGDSAFAFASQAGVGDHAHGVHGGGSAASGHVHGPNCEHGKAGGATMDHDHDVSSGKAAEMER
jgi:hypothetical protein